MSQGRFFFFGCVYILGLAGALAASEAERRFVRGLADRNLFESVEFFCDAELKRSELSKAEQSLLAAELLRSRTRQMLQAEPRRREAIRQSLSEFEGRYLADPDDFSRPDEALARQTLRFQRAIADASLGDWLVREAKIAPESERDGLLREARKTLADALDGFKNCDARLNELRQRLGNNRDVAFDREWLALLRSVQIQWGLAQQSLALSFPPDSEDREFSLNAAVALLEQTARLNLDEAAIYRSRIELAGCLRMLGQRDACVRLLQELQKADLSKELRFQAETERLRYLIATGALELALKDYEADRSGSECYPEFDLARLELYLAVGRKLREDAKDKPTGTGQDEQDRILREVLALTRRIEQRSGLFWGRRARMLLTEASLSEAEELDESILTLLGLDQYQNGRYAESIRLFEQATDQALEAGDAKSAFKNALHAAGIQAEVLGRLEEDAHDDETAAYHRRMVDRLMEIAKRFPRDPQAPEVFLMAVDQASEAVLKKNLSLADFAKLHADFAEIWPDSPKTPPVLFRAARILQEGRDDPAGALTLLEKIPNGAEVGVRAVELAGRSMNALLATRTTQAAAPIKTESEAAAWFAARLPKDALAAWTEADARSGLLATEYWVRAIAANPAEAGEAPRRAEQTLRSVLARYPALSPTARAQAQVLLVTVLTGQGRQAEGNEILKTLNENQIAALSPEEKRAFRRTQVSLYADTGRLDAALDLIRELLKESPKDLSLLEMQAEVLTRRGSEAALAEAMQIWTQIASKTERDSETWWKCRERILELYVKQGKEAEAKRNFQRLRVLYPELGGDVRRARLEKLYE